MSLKRGKDRNYTYQEFTLVDERRNIFPTCWLLQQPEIRARDSGSGHIHALEGASGLRPSANTKLSPVAISNAIQTHPMGGHHGEANRCPAAIRRY
jgi:hypothetical protein